MDAEQTADQCNALWLFARWLSSNTSQEIPGWSGFISGMGKVPSSTTTIDYYPVINCPITEYKTVQQCHKYSEQATEEVGQEYVLTTFDIGVCMKDYPLHWNSPQWYEKHIVLIGSFHVMHTSRVAMGWYVEVEYSRIFVSVTWGYTDT